MKLYCFLAPLTMPCHVLDCYFCLTPCLTFVGIWLILLIATWPILLPRYKLLYWLESVLSLAWVMYMLQNSSCLDPCLDSNLCLFLLLASPDHCMLDIQPVTGLDHFHMRYLLQTFCALWNNLPILEGFWRAVLSGESAGCSKVMVGIIALGERQLLGLKLYVSLFSQNMLSFQHNV